MIKREEKKIYILYVGNKLSKHGYTPTSIETIGEWLKEDYKIKQVSDKRSPILRLFEMFLTTLIFSGNIVIIDVYSSNNFYYAIIVSLLCKAKMMPYIAVIRGGEFPQRMKRSPIKVEFLLNNAAAVIAPSNYIKERMKKEWKGEVQVIPNTIDIKKYKFRHRKDITPRLLWVRSFHKVYNPNLALDVLKYLKKNFPQARLCMVGPDKDGSLELFKEYAKKLNLQNSIELTGRLSKQDWHKKSEDYDIFLNTTNADNTPVSVMEAMALGMPVITTNVGGIPYLFEDKKEGLMVPPKNPVAIADQVMKLLNDVSYTSQLSEAARKKACQWDWTIVKKQWIKVINEVAR